MTSFTPLMFKQSRVAFQKKQSTPKSGHFLVTSMRSHLTPLFRYLSSLRRWLMRVQLKSDPIRFLYPFLYRSAIMALLPDPSSIIFMLGDTNSPNSFLMAEKSTYQSQTSCCSSSYLASQQASSSYSGKFSGQFLLARNSLYLVMLANEMFDYCVICNPLFHT